MALSLSSRNVIQYLLDLGLDTPQALENSRVEAAQQPAKNFNLLISLPTDRKLLVKQERRGRDGQTANEFFNEWRFHQLLQEFLELGSIRPSVSEVIHFDHAESIIVYNYLTNYHDLDTFYHRRGETFSTIVAATVGTILATLHRSTFNRQECNDFITQTPKDKVRFLFGNPARRMERIGPEIFGAVPRDCVKFFVLYQRYDSLAAAIADLSDHWQPCCVVHNDLKLNNVLLHNEWDKLPVKGDYLLEGIVRLIDWERCSWGDPGFDLGTLLSSYLLIWLGSLVVDPSLQLEESLRLAASPLEQLQPSMAALARAYFSTFPEILEQRPDFLNRVVQFSGLALIKQIEAMIQYQKAFNNTGICMLQVAKTLLCRPQQSIATVFGMSESDILSLSAAAA